MKGKQFLLMLIGSFGCTIKGETRLQKLTFLAGEEYGIKLPFEFTWSNYGPFSGDVRDHLQSMEIEGLLKQEEIEIGSSAGTYTIRQFTLTEEGKKALNSIREEHRAENEAIKNLVECFGRKPFHYILTYVYGRYEKTEGGEIIASSTTT